MNARTIALALLGLFITGLTVAGCGERTRDAPRAPVDEKSQAVVIQMPDGFSNIATKCVNGLRYSTIFHNLSGTKEGAYGSLSVVADPNCPAPVTTTPPATARR